MSVRVTLDDGRVEKSGTIGSFAFPVLLPPEGRFPRGMVVRYEPYEGRARGVTE